MDYSDILYGSDDGIATITINRPEVLNAFRSQTVEEMIDAFKQAWADRSVGCVILTGAGERAFCTGGDQKQRAATGDYGPSRSGLFEIDTLHAVIRQIPKPVIAAVNGYAIGGGHVLHVICDLTIAADSAQFGQTGPRVGSFDAGFGSAYLARVVGEKRAREIWFLCRRYSAEQAREWGLVNEVVSAGELMETARAWGREICEKSPTALAMLKASFNADTDHHHGLTAMAMRSLEMFVKSDEAREGVQAFNEKRPPDFSPFR